MATSNLLKEILQGGACNPDIAQSNNIQTSNPLKNLFYDLLFKKSKLSQRVNGYFPDEAIEDPIQPSNPPESMLTKEQSLSSHKENDKDFSKYWSQSQTNVSMQERNHLPFYEKNWFNPETNQELFEPHVNPEAEMYLMDRLRDMNLQTEFQFRESLAYQNQRNNYVQMYDNLKQVHAPEIVIDSKERVENTIKTMENDDDSRFKTSKFLAFIKQVQSGQQKVEKQRIIQVNLETKMKDQRSAFKENTFVNKTEVVSHDLEAEMEAIWDEEEAKLTVEEKTRNNDLETCKVTLKDLKLKSTTFRYQVYTM